MHRQHVDDVGPVVTSLVAVAEQLRGDRVTVGLVADQDTAEIIAGEWVEGLEQDAEVGLTHVKMFTARATTSPKITSEMSSSSAIESLAQGTSGIASVGLNATAEVKDR
ncbi:MAG TPA: hypothetical protein VHN56_04765 [Actinomycetota bacterium]|jgi:hypothetical protein|nr:hypothetical protein [Actinomycetota bacterium]